MQRKKQVKKNAPKAKIAPEVRRELNRAAFYLNRHINRPLDGKSLLQEAMRLYKQYPFKYVNYRNCVPAEAASAMADFLIVKGAINTGFTPDEVSNVRKIIKSYDVTTGEDLKMIDGIGEGNLRRMYLKVEALSDNVLPGKILPHADFSELAEENELHHLAKIGSETATYRVNRIKAALGQYFK
jgi:hypothetical protein